MYIILFKRSDTKICFWIRPQKNILFRYATAVNSVVLISMLPDPRSSTFSFPSKNSVPIAEVDLLHRKWAIIISRWYRNFLTWWMDTQNYAKSENDKIHFVASYLNRLLLQKRLKNLISIMLADRMSRLSSGIWSEITLWWWRPCFHDIIIMNSLSEPVFKFISM